MENKSRLVLDYDLTIKNAHLLRESLTQSLAQYDQVTVIVNPPSIIDLSGMQLLLAARKQAGEMFKELRFQFNLPEEISDLLEKAGFRMDAINL